MTDLIRHLAPRLALILSLSGALSGCQEQLQAIKDYASAKDLRKSQTQPTAEKNSVGKDHKYNTGLGSTTYSPPSAPTTSLYNYPPDWPMKKGLGGINNGTWLDIGALTIGSLGIAIGWLNNRKLFSVSSKLSAARKDMQSNIRYVINLEKKINEIERIQISNATIRERTTQRITKTPSTIGQDFEQVDPLRQRINDGDRQVMTSIQHQPLPPTPLSTQPSQPFHPSQPTQPSPRTPGQLRQELTDAINRGDRQEIRNRTVAQLNITSISENEISTGRLVATQLEEVSAGGSFLLAIIEEQAWIYPTELTLQGFKNHQPQKGVFNYVKHTIPAPQVVNPASLSKSSLGWQVVEMGTIAVPG